MTTRDKGITLPFTPDWLSVYDAPFNCRPDGVTDNRLGLQAAINTGRKLVFPNPSGVEAFYNYAGTLLLGATQTNWVGEPKTVLRKTDAGRGIDFPGGVGGNQFHTVRDLSFSANSAALATMFNSANGVYTNYIVDFHLENCNFYQELFAGIDGNLIRANIGNCTFGSLGAVKAAGNRGIKSSFGGSANTNLNEIHHTQFFNLLGDAINFTGGGQLKLTQVDCEGNAGRDLSAQDMSMLECDQFYTERNSNASSAIALGSTTAQAICTFKNSQLSQLMPNSLVLFAGGNTQRIMFDGCVAGLNAAGFLLFNNNTGDHIPPVDGSVGFKNHFQVGNAADPSLLWSGFYESGAFKAFSPAPTNLTVVNGTGGVTYAGKYRIQGRQCFWQIDIITTGTATTSAAASGASFFAGITGVPVPVASFTFPVVNSVSLTNMGSGLNYINGRFLLPAWAAIAGSISLSGVFTF